MFRAFLPLFAAGALLAAPIASSLADDAPLGEPLHLAAKKFGLSDAEAAQIRSAGGELSCPGDGNDGARLNAWLIAPSQILTNAHGIVESEEDPGHPYLRQPIYECYFSSAQEFGKDRQTDYLLNLNGLGAVLRRGAVAPVDPSNAVGGDVVKLRLEKTVPNAVPLAFDPTPVKEGDPLILISRVPTANRTASCPETTS